MNVFLTGGSGFLGKQVIKRLLKDAHQVYALSRSKESAQTVQKLGAQPVEGSLENTSDFSSKLNGIDVVVHCAAPMEFWGIWDKFQREIVDATVNLATAACERGVKRFIFISSESVLQEKADLVDIDESQPYPAEPNSYYGKSKKIAEEQLLRMQGKMEIVVLRPTFIWGPGCPAFKTLQTKVNTQQFMWIDQGKASFEAVHVENVAEAISLALTKGHHRETYFITDNEPATVRDFFGKLFSALKLPIPKRSVPKLIVLPIAGLLEAIWKGFSVASPPPLTRFDLAFVAMGRRYNITKAITVLGYCPQVTRNQGFRALSDAD